MRGKNGGAWEAASQRRSDTAIRQDQEVNGNAADGNSAQFVGVMICYRLVCEGGDLGEPSPPRGSLSGVSRKVRVTPLPLAEALVLN